MTESTGTQQKEKAAKVKRQPEREPILQRTFATARHNAGGNAWLEEHHGGGLLQRQCACGQHTIAGEECEGCRQKREAALQRMSPVSRAQQEETPDQEELILTKPLIQRQALPGSAGMVQTSSHSGPIYDFSRVPSHTVTLQTKQIIQAHLTVNAPGDQYEQEADRVADTVMRMPAPAELASEDSDGWLNQPATINRLPVISRLQASSEDVPAVSPQLEAQIQHMQGGGQALPTEERTFFEARMGHDFSEVRVHTDPTAVQTSRELSAQAFTLGQHIAFNEGAYQPGTEAGRRLMAHELTHVVQQGAARGPVARSHFPPGLGRATAQPVSSPLLQRACGRSGIGTNVAGCAGISGEVVGELILFRVNCDDFLTPTEQQKVETFAASMIEGDTVKIHGFASVDGAPDYNDDLSCARANRVANLLQSKGVSSLQIELFKHGPTPGAAQERRSVILERDPPVSRPPQKKVTVNITHLHDSSGNAGSAITYANTQVYHQANITITKGQEITLDETQSKAILGNDLILDEYPSPNSPTTEEKDLLKVNQTPGAITIYYVKDLSQGSLGEAFWPALGHGFVGVIVGNSGTDNTFSHELGHVLLDSGDHNVPDDTYLMHATAPNPTKLTPAEIATMQASPFAK